MQVWFKNRRAKIRQQAAQGKPIVTNSESDAANSTKSPPKLKKSSSPAPASTPPSSTSFIKTEARSPTGAADSSSGYLFSASGREKISIGDYPSPALTPGSDYPTPTAVSSFWSPITPPEGLDGPGSGFDSRLQEMKDGNSRAPPTLVQMQV